MMKQRIEYSRISSFLYSSLINLACSQYYIVSIFNLILSRFIGVSGGTIFFNLIFLVLLLVSIRFDVRRTDNRVIVFFAFITFICYLATYRAFSLFGKNLLLYVSIIDYIRVFLYMIPLTFVASRIDDLERLLIRSVNFSYFMIIYCSLILFKQYYTSSGYDDYDMLLGYQLAFYYILILSSIFVLRRKINYFILIYLFLIILSIASRGALLTIIISTIVMIMIYIIKFVSISAKPYIIVVACVGGYSLISKIDKFLVYINQILQDMNVNSRTIKQLQNTYMDNVYLSGRDMIWNKAFALLKSRPFLGYGLFGDRVFLNGFYVHNIGLELLFQFGYFIGLLIIIMVLCKFVIFTFSMTSRNEILVVLFGCYTLSYLFFSSSYLILVYFWIFIGFLINRRYKGVKDESKTKICS